MSEATTRARDEPVTGSRISGRRTLAAAGLEPLLRWLLVANVIFIPILVPRGPQNTVPTDVPATLLILLGSACLWRARHPIRVPLSISYLLIVTGGIVAAAQSLFPAIALTAVGIDIYLFLWFVVVLNCLLLAGDRAMRWVIATWVGVAVFIGVLSGLAASTGTAATPRLFGFQIIDQFDRFSGTFKDPNMAGSYLVVALFVLWAAPWPRRLLSKAVLSIPILFAVQQTRSNTALAAIAAGSVVILLVSFVRSRRSAVGATVAVLALAFLVVSLAPGQVVQGPAELTRTLGQEAVFQGSLTRADSSLGARVARIQEALRLFGPDVLLGIGPSTTNDTLSAIDAPITGELHNDFAAAIIERGLVGLLGVVSLFAIALTASVKLALSDALRDQGWRTMALLGAVVSVSVTALSLETLHFRHVWFLFAVVYALAYKESPSPEREPKLAPTLQGTGSR